MKQPTTDVFTEAGRRTALLHDDVIAVCRQTGRLELRRPIRDQLGATHNGGRAFECLTFVGASVLTPDADEAALLGIVSALHGSERLQLHPTDGNSEDFRLWKLVAKLPTQPKPSPVPTGEHRNE